MEVAHESGAPLPAEGCRQGGRQWARLCRTRQGGGDLPPPEMFIWVRNTRHSDPSRTTFLDPASPDIVDIKPANMEDLTEVITASEFHPHHCNLFVYSSSKGSLRLCDMRAAALCDKHSKRKCPLRGGRRCAARAPWSLALDAGPGPAPQIPAQRGAARLPELGGSKWSAASCGSVPDIRVGRDRPLAERASRPAPQSSVGRGV